MANHLLTWPNIQVEVLVGEERTCPPFRARRVHGHPRFLLHVFGARFRSTRVSEVVGHPGN